MDGFSLAAVWDGQTLEYDRREYLANLKWLATGPVTITIQKEKRTRTLQSNRYYWGVVIPILAEHWGYTKDELHEALKWKFLRVDNPDVPLPTVKSTATLSTQDFARYLESVMQLAAEDGCVIPEAVAG